MGENNHTPDIWQRANYFQNTERTSKIQQNKDNPSQKSEGSF